MAAPVQAPYFAQVPSRLEQVPALYNVPWHGGTSQPMDVIQHFQIPDYFDKIKKGMDIGRELGKLPTEGAENVLKKTMISLSQERAKGLQAAIKQIEADPSLQGPQNAEARNAALTNAYIMSGFEPSISGGQFGGGFYSKMPADVYGYDYFRNRAFDLLRHPPPAPINTDKGVVKQGDLIQIDPKTGKPIGTIKTDQTGGDSNVVKPSPSPSPPADQNKPGFEVPHSGGRKVYYVPDQGTDQGTRLVSTDVGYQGGVPPAAWLSGLTTNAPGPSGFNPVVAPISPYDYNTEGGAFPAAQLV